VNLVSDLSSEFSKLLTLLITYSPSTLVNKVVRFLAVVGK